jgi:hypothetical protein
MTIKPGEIIGVIELDVSLHLNTQGVIGPGARCFTALS